MSSRRLVVVNLDTFKVGLDVHRVLEVLVDRPVIPVPGSPPAVRGLVNLRGQLASVVGARIALGLPPREGPGAVHVVTRTGTDLVVLEADAEDGVVDVDPEGSHDPPGHLPDELAAAVVEVHRLEGGLLLELDLDHVLNAVIRSDAPIVAEQVP